MAVTTTIRITDNKASKSLYDTDKPARLARWGVGNVAKYLRAIGTGIRKATVTVQVDGTAGVKASGTLTLSSASGTVGGVINGVTITRAWATSDTATATALAADINASANALVAKVVTASAAAGVVTVTAYVPGKLGNCVTLAASGTGVTASAARLASGAGDDVAEVSYNLL